MPGNIHVFSARSSRVARVNIRDVPPATIAVTQIQGSRGARLALAVALIAVSLHTLCGKGVAGAVTLDAGARADVAVYLECLFQTRRNSAIGAYQQVRLPGSFEYCLRALYSFESAAHVCRV